MLKRILITLALGVLVAVCAKAVGLGWNPYSDPAVNTIKIYAAPGLNSLVGGGLASSNTAAVFTTNVPAGSVSVTFSVPFSGPWNFVATAVTTNGVESVNSNQTSTNLPPGAPVNLRLQ